MKVLAISLKAYGVRPWIAACIQIRPTASVRFVREPSAASSNFIQSRVLFFAAVGFLSLTKPASSSFW